MLEGCAVEGEQLPVPLREGDRGRQNSTQPRNVSNSDLLAEHAGSRVNPVRTSVFGLCHMSVSQGHFSRHVTCISVIFEKKKKHCLQPFRFVSEIPSKSIGSGTILA